MITLWTGGELAAAMQARPIGALPSGVGGLSIDTRSLQPGDAFGWNGGPWETHMTILRSLKRPRRLS